MNLQSLGIRQQDIPVNNKAINDLIETKIPSRWTVI